MHCELEVAVPDQLKQLLRVALELFLRVNVLVQDRSAHCAPYPKEESARVSAKKERADMGNRRSRCAPLRFFGPSLSGANGGTGPEALPHVTIVPFLRTISKSESKVSLPTPSNTPWTPRSMPSEEAMHTCQRR